MTKPGPKPRPSSELRVMRSFRLSRDVIEILSRQTNASRYIEDAVREKNERRTKHA